MTKKEMAEIFTMMQTNYPDEFKDKSDSYINGKINLWLMSFRDDNYTDVLTAVMAHINTDTNRFMPPVGVIKAKLVEIRTGDEMTPQEAWELVSRATRNSTYNSGEEFDKLPPVVQRIVGSPMQLKEWAAMEADSLQSVVASNFQRSYKVRASKEREFLALPSAVQQAMTQIAAGMKMPELPSAPTDQERNAVIRRLEAYGDG